MRGPGGSATHRRKHRRWMSAARLAISAGLLLWLLPRAGVGAIGSVILRASPWWLIAGLLLGFASTAVQATQWHRLLRTVGLERTWRRCLRLVYVGYAFNTVLPSAVGGDVIRAVSVVEDPRERAGAAASVLLQRLCNFPGMMALLAVGLAASTNDAYPPRMRLVAIVAALIGSGIVLVAFGPLPGIGGRFGIGHRWRIFRALASLLLHIDAVRRRRRALGSAVVRGLMFWTLQVFSQICFMRAVGIHPPLAYAAVVVTTVNLATLLPVSINGYGVREGGYAAFLVLPRLATTAQAIASSFLLAGQMLIWGIIGVICLAAPKPASSSLVRAQGEASTVQRADPGLVEVVS